MRDSIRVCLCGVLLCAGLIVPACGSSDKKNDGFSLDAGLGGHAGAGRGGGTGGLGTGGAGGTGGVSLVGGASTTGGASSAGGTPGTGGVMTADAGQDGAADAPTILLDAPVDQRLDGNPRDGSAEPDARVDGTATSSDVGNPDGSLSKVDAGSGTTPAACAAAGGFCSRNRWTTCPAHYEPVGEGTGHLDCPSAGWCCVPAPSSPCSDEGRGNCVVGSSCSGCWSSAPGAPACESGRVCCVDICD